MLPHTQISRLLAGVAGLLASLACGWQVYWLTMLGLWGAPPNPLHPIAAIGALLLLVTSIILLFGGGRISAIACALATAPLWVFYGPATIASIGDRTAALDVMHVVPFVPPSLLILTTALAIYAAARRDPPAASAFEVAPLPPP